MRFNSLSYLLFLALVVPVIHLLPRRGQNLALVGASYLFYGWWDWRFCGLLLLSTVVDFFAARRIRDSDSDRARRAALTVSIVVNLGVLGLFKYHGFFVESFTTAMAALGVTVHARTLGLLLPVGISFYTFQTLAYTVDVYRGKVKATDAPIDFMLYVAFFPQLVAGPIERARNLLPQLQAERVLTPTFLRTGITLLLIGWFKKVGIADGVAPLVDEIYADPGSFSAVSVGTANLLFALQVYCDFSGYSDIARGTARLLGIDLMVNFAQPFLSQSTTEFWRRWHISLSSWFVDYVYIPLGGSRSGPWRGALNAMIVFMVSGLWHGASWSFVVFGTVCGASVVIHRAWSSLPFNRGVKVPRASLRGVVGIGVTFLTFGVALIFFRSLHIAQAWTVMGALVFNPWLTGHEHVFVGAFVLYALPLLALDLWQLNTEEEEPMLRLSRPMQGLLLGSVALWVLIMGGVDTDVPFVYFQF